MTAATLNRYTPGGDLYSLYASKYGTPGANKVYAAAQTDYSGETYGAVAAAIDELKYGPQLNDSTASILWDQLTTNPLQAPLESANNQIGNAVKDIFKNPWVLFALGVTLFWTFGGFTLVHDWLAKKTR